MSNSYSIKSSTSTQPNAAAKQIDSATRQWIGVSALAGKEPISYPSRHHDTSRKFIYDQKHKVSSALADAFSDNGKDSDVLFYIPVTREWLQQVVLALILICHSSYGGVIEFFRDIFAQHISRSTVFNITQSALSKAAEM